MTTAMLIAVIIAVFVAMVIIFGIIIYNGLVQANIKAKEAWSGITVQLKRRADLIPNLVNTVKGYAAHESTVFEDVANVRAASIQAADQGPKQASAVEGDVQKTMKSIFAVAEAYPELKADANFRQLQEEITDTEDKIQASRRFYNSAVTQFNTRRTTFPGNLFAGPLGFKEDKEFYEVSQAEAAAIEKPVEVKF